MKQYIEVNESNTHYCNACGKKYNDSSMEEKIMYKISFVSEDNAGTSSQCFNLCWNCTKILSKKMEEARYNSMCR